MGGCFGIDAWCMPRENDGADSDPKVDISITYRNVPASRVCELTRYLENLSLHSPVEPSAGPNPYFVVPAPEPEVQVAEHVPTQRESSPDRRAEPGSWAAAFECANCGRSTRTAPGEGVFCRNRECHLSPRYQPAPEPAPTPAPATGNQFGCRWCQAIKRKGLEQCSNRPEPGTQLCPQYHREWRARGGRLVEDLSAAELLQLVRPANWDR